MASSYESLDAYYIFFGGYDHYDFKIAGMTEMYVPYNNNRLVRRPIAEVLGRTFANPDDMRYELHRVGDRRKACGRKARYRRATTAPSRRRH